MDARTLIPRTRTDRRAHPPEPSMALHRAIDPATFEVLGTLPLTPESHLPDLIQRARRAHEAWRNLPFGARKAPLEALKALIRDRAEAIAASIAQGMGKPRVEALDGEVARVLEQLEACLEEREAGLPDLRGAGMDGARTRLRLIPHGVVAILTPWTDPFEGAMGPAILALGAGNAVILKANASAPLVGELIEGLFVQAFREHPGLVQGIQGAKALGSALSTAEGVDLVVFRGSAKAARLLQGSLAPLLRPALLDLGACNPMVVCEDAPLDRAAAAAVLGGFLNNGQSGRAVKRVYVHRPAAPAFLQHVVARVRALRQGSPLKPDTDLGPLANDHTQARLRMLLHDALDRGAHLEAGGFPSFSSGWYWPPTVLSGVDPSMRIMKEEAFGPILPIQAVDSDEEAIRMANARDPSRMAWVFSGSRSRARTLADRMKAREVLLNEMRRDTLRSPPGFFGNLSPLDPFLPYGHLKILTEGDWEPECSPAGFPHDEAGLMAVRSALRDK